MLGHLVKAWHSNKTYLLVFLIKLAAALAAVLVNVAVARILPIYEAGVYFASISLAVLIANVSRLGLEIGFVTYVGRHDGYAEPSLLWSAYKTASLMVLAFSVLLSISVYSVLLISSSEWLSPLKDGRVFSVILLGVPAMALTALQAHCFRAVGSPIHFAVFFGLIQPLGVLCLLPITQAFFSENALAYAYISAALVSLIASTGLWYFYSYRRNEVNYWLSKPYTHHAARTMFSGGNNFLVSTTQILMLSSGSLIVLLLNDTGLIARFNVANRVAMFTPFMFAAVNAVVAPKFARLHTLEQYSKLQVEVSKASNITFLFGLIFAVIIIASSGLILKIFGADYVAARSVLIILVLAFSTPILAGPAKTVLISTGNERFAKYAAILGLVVMWGSSTIFIEFGIVGVAWAFFLGLGSENILLSIFVFKTLNINTLPSARRTLSEDK